MSIELKTLLRPIESLSGIGPARAGDYRRLGIRCIADLVRHLPMRYEREHQRASIAEALRDVSDELVTVEGEIASTRQGRGRAARFEALLADETESVTLTWFNAPWMARRLHPGQRVRVTGKLTSYRDSPQIVNPRCEDVPDTEEIPAGGEDHRLRPIYPTSGSLTSAAISGAVTRVLDEALTEIDDHLPAEFREERGLLELRAAYRAMHAPTDEDAIAAARRRLAYDELLLLQLGVMMKRRHRHDHLAAPALEHSDEVAERILQRIPFELTPSQRTVIDEIVGDLERTVPMNRLLQGDVGAGKTVVALYAMLLAVVGGAQAALMAPTELLAEQHFLSIQRMLEDSAVRIELLTGSMRAAERREILDRLARGEIDIIVGTHALLTTNVEFNALALAVIDEQHRFGVHQRADLRGKGTAEGAAAHVLVMTATPIPRTLSLTIFGDLDISTIRELPPGRSPVATRVAHPSTADAVYADVAAHLERGEQAYIVVPVIEESDSGLTDVTSHIRALESGPLSRFRLAAVHGRLDRTEREAIMHEFREGRIDALIATTVIEVGVDVPNATIMVIEHAERFGLAQLHQLRGRVGRGSLPGTCVLIGAPTTDEGEQRLGAITSTTDGFVIAERDLEIRGPGELFGARQSGLAPFRVARLPRDLELLRLARRDAAEWIDRSPALAAEEETLLRRRLLKVHGEALGLGDVA